MITVDVKQLLIYAVLLALFVLIIYLIFLVKRLFTTLELLNKDLDDADGIIVDAKVVSGIAADRSKDLDIVITDVTGVVSTITDDANNNQGLIKTGINVGKAVASAGSFIKEHKEEKEQKEFEEYKKEKKAKKKAEKKESK